MIQENKLKKFFAVFLSIVMATSVVAQSSRNERTARPTSSVSSSSSDGGRSSSTSGGSSSASSSRTSSSSSRNERSERSTNERPSRPSGERPVRPQSSNHVSSGHSHHNEHHGSHHDPHHNDYHHHHGHSSGAVVVAGTGYSGAASTTYAAAPAVSRKHDINKFMLFANLSGGVSYRGASGVTEYEYCDEDDQIAEENRAFGKSLGYNVEIRTDVGLSRRLFCSSGVGFSKQSFYKMFSPGNYMSSTKRFLEIPLMFGIRDGDDDLIFSLSIGPRFTYGINGKCKEYYDFYPYPEYGLFTHESYGGKYGVDRFSVGAGLEANIVVYKLLLGLNFSLYPNNDCKPAEIYDGLYRRFHSCRTNISIKAGWRIF